MGTVWAPFAAHFDRQLPGIGCKVVGLMGGLLGISYVIAHINEENDGRMFLEKMATYKTATELADKGFWKSHSEDMNDRVQAHNLDAIRLDALWEKALADSTQDNSFDALNSNYLEWIVIKEVIGNRWVDFKLCG